LKSVESGVSSDGDGRPSDLDEFGDNGAFCSYAEGRLSLKIEIATKANAKSVESIGSEAAPMRLSGSGAPGDNEFGAFEDFQS